MINRRSFPTAHFLLLFCILESLIECHRRYNKSYCCMTLARLNLPFSSWLILVPMDIPCMGATYCQVPIKNPGKIFLLISLSNSTVSLSRRAQTSPVGMFLVAHTNLGRLAGLNIRQEEVWGQAT